MENIPFNVDTVVPTLLSLFCHQQRDVIVKILENANSSIENTDYDNWNGGTYYYTLYLDIVVELFAYIESSLSRYEKEIESKLQVVLRETGNYVLNKVVMRPILVDKLVSDPSALITEENLKRIWGNSQLRLFISHQHTNKTDAISLKNQLAQYSISAFVAHEDIKPTLPWQREIKFALNTMNVFVALLTSRFRESKWTDQEIGFAVAKKVLMIHVRDGLDPYGFIGETQALSISIDSSELLASEIINIVQKDSSTCNKMREVLFAGLENSYNYKMACKIMNKIELLDNGITPDEIQRIRKAANDNARVKDAYTVKDFLKRMKKIPVTEDLPF